MEIVSGIFVVVIIAVVGIAIKTKKNSLQRKTDNSDRVPPPPPTEEDIARAKKFVKDSNIRF